MKNKEDYIPTEVIEKKSILLPLLRLFLIVSVTSICFAYINPESVSKAIGLIGAMTALIAIVICLFLIVHNPDYLRDTRTVKYLRENRRDKCEVMILPDGRMDTENAARYLDLSKKTLAMKRSQGTGPVYIKRGKIFYYKDDLDKWMKGDNTNES